MRTIALSLTLLVLPVVPAGAHNPAAATKIHRVFDIVRGNDKIGTATLDIERQNDTTTIKIKTDLSVKVMFIEAYRYEHSCNETWKNGQLVAFKSRTNDNGTKHSIDVTAAPDKLSMVADGKHSDLPSLTMDPPIGEECDADSLGYSSKCHIAVLARAIVYLKYNCPPI